MPIRTTARTAAFIPGNREKKEFEVDTETNSVSHISRLTGWEMNHVRLR